VTGRASTARTDRVLERRRAVALARHYREFEGLSIRQIADRLGRSPATIKAYFYDPMGEKARAVKAPLRRGVPWLRRLHAAAQRQGRRLRVHPGAIQPRWTRELVISAMLAWRDRYGRWPSSYDWSRTHAQRRGGHALRRLAGGRWPSASVINAVFGTWAAARQAAAAKGLGDHAPPEQYDHGSSRTT
jgi:AcrR family transcriptional regulator